MGQMTGSTLRFSRRQEECYLRVVRVAISTVEAVFRLEKNVTRIILGTVWCGHRLGNASVDIVDPL